MIVLKKAIIFEANNGEEAVHVYHKEMPDLILMDIQMPEMDGFADTKMIRQLESTQNKHTPILALTAGVVMDEKEKCFLAGMDSFLTKPLKLDALKFEVFKFLNTLA